MSIKCTHPAAVNYNPAATEDDGSCIYLEKVDDVCYAFEDANGLDVEDRSFTLSWSTEMNNWVFFHDYVPDFLFTTRGKLHSLKGNEFYAHNTGPYGQYYSPDKSSFFMDVVFNFDAEATLDTLEWLTEVLSGDINLRDKTLTHITVWNSRQCSGKIAVTELFLDLNAVNTRDTKGRWSFNDFRDKVKQEGIAFLQDLFHNFAVIGSALSETIPWFEQQLLEDVYFVVRFEFDNLSGYKVFLHDTDAQITPSAR